MEQKEELILYQAYGLVKMKIYSYTDGERVNYFGILDIPGQENIENFESDKITVKITPRIKKTLDNRISFSQLVNSGKSFVCVVYPKTTEDFKLKRFRIKNIYSDESKAPPNLNLFRIRGKVDYINIERQRIIIRIIPQSSNLREFDMGIKCHSIKHELQNIELGQFWEINAELANNEFWLKSGSMIQEKNDNDTTNIISRTPILKSKLVDTSEEKTDTNTSLLITEEAPEEEPQLVNVTTNNNKTTDMVPVVETELNNAASAKTKKKKKKTTTQEAPVQQEEGVTRGERDKGSTSPTPELAPPLVEKQPVNEVTEQTVPQEINRHMQVRSEVTIKISGSLPQAVPTPNKKVQVEITDQNGINFTAILNPKSWKKAETSVAQFADWSGMISGKLGKTEQGLEIIDAGIQIFEKKPKEVKEEVKPEES